MTQQKPTMKDLLFSLRDDNLDEVKDILFRAGVMGGSSFSRSIRKFVSEIVMGDSKAENILAPALYLASSEGHLKCVELLCQFVDPKTEYSRALRTATAKGHANVVSFLAPISEPDAGALADRQIDSALCIAAKAGNVECVDILIPYSSMTLWDFDAIREASIRGHFDCVVSMCKNFPSIEGAVRKLKETDNLEAVALLESANMYAGMQTKHINETTQPARRNTGL